jgi:NodT family efflux transporter outer membrane factor (OMF) lipoprotein
MAIRKGGRSGAVAALGLTALLAACAVGPDFEEPPAPEVERYTAEALPAATSEAVVEGGAAQRFVQDLDIPGEWWTLFRSEALNELIKEAFAANPSIQAARATLRQAWETVYAEQGTFLPTLTANYSPLRAKTATAALAPVGPGPSPYYTLHTAQLQISYSPDVFGGERRTVESLTALAEVQRFTLEATYLTLSSNIVATAIQEASLRGQIAATEAIIKLETSGLEILRKQYALGQVAMADVAAQEAALAAAQASLPPLRKQLATQRDLLTALTGHPSSEQPKATFELAALQLPQEVPVSLPAKLVDQRPDVQSAEAQLHSASALVGVAVAAQLPNVSLTAAYGGTASALSRLFTPGTGFWTLAGSITQPIFDYGTLRHKRRAAEAAFDAAAAQYRNTVIGALQNVADALYALQADADALRAAVAAEQAATKSLTITQAQLQLGAVNYLALITAQQAFQQAQINLVQAQASRFADTAALFQALGGGWWNRRDGEERQAAAGAGKTR